MSRLLVILGVLCALGSEVQAHPVSRSTVTEFKDNLARKYTRTDVPYVYLPQVMGHVSVPNLAHIEKNWQKLSLSFRKKTFQAFQVAGLEKFFWLMLLESGADPNKVSPAGAIGLYQVMPGIAKDVCHLMKADLFDPQKNATCAATIMKGCQRFNGWQAQAICYNGKLATCEWKGYQKCLAAKAKAGNHRVLESLHFPVKLFLYQKVGENFFLEDLQLDTGRIATKR